MKDYIQTLQKCSLFSGISAGDIEKLTDCMGCRRASFFRGNVLWLTGDPVEHCGVVLRGSVRAESIGYGGDRSVITMHRTASVFGDVLMSTPESRSPVDVVAAEDCEVLFIPVAKLMSGCENCCLCHERLRVNLLGEISKKFWALREKIKYISEKSLRTRIAMYLLDRRACAGADTFSVELDRQQLAEYLGANRSALSRELGRMRDEGMLSFYRDTFKLHDTAALRAVFGGAEA